MNSSLEAWKRAPLPPLPAEEPLLDVGRDGISPNLAELVGQALDLAPLYAAPAYFGDPPPSTRWWRTTSCRCCGRWAGSRSKSRWSGGASTWRSFTACRAHRSSAFAFIVEAKRPHRGVESHLAQARDYLRSQGVERDVVVTDGLRYRLYAADQEYTPVAYANLERLKESQLGLFERLRRQS